MADDHAQVELKKAKSSVYRLLKIRLRSEKELRDKLNEKKIRQTVIDSVIKHLREINYIDDRIFAKAWNRIKLKVDKAAVSTLRMVGPNDTGRALS